MMEETAILKAEGCPEVMLAAQDVPWDFIGEIYEADATPRAGVKALAVPKLPLHHMRRYCACGFIQTRGPYVAGSQPEAGEVHVIDLLAYEFIDDDMLITKIYWGQCPACKRVAWARLGPPYERARAYIFAP